MKPSSQNALPHGGAPKTHAPWFTSGIAALALVIYALPRLTDTLIYDRAWIGQGEWWRLVTGNWVHFSGSHLLWNLVVLVPTGIWLERFWPGRARLLMIFAPAVIGVTLFTLDPALSRFAGLSGLTAGTLTLLALTHISLRTHDNWFWRGILGLVVLKILAETLVDHPFFAQFVQEDVHAVPLAHVAGLMCAWVCISDSAAGRFSVASNRSVVLLRLWDFLTALPRKNLSPLQRPRLPARANPTLRRGRAAGA